MPAPSDLTLTEHFGLLRALCERNGYFTADQVQNQDVPLAVAVERYGKDGVPPPEAVIYESWGTQPILAGILKEPSSSAALPYLRCAAVAQQSLGSRSVDMLLLLIGPDCSSRDAKWISAAASIEDDDRICRKLVWLPDGDLTASAESLLTRSPFARPWRGAYPIDAQAGAIDRLISDGDELDDIAMRAESSNLPPADFIRQALLAGGGG